MNNRDEFLPKVRQAVALRAGYLCSFEGCSALTVGPSDESALAVSRVGVAAHIHAAAPGGKRYLASMNPTERSSIENAVWMCHTHGTLIDQDDVTYTADRLRSMKKAHEDRVADQLASNKGTVRSSDLIALGPGLIFAGEIVGSAGRRWTLRIDHFVVGSLSDLVLLGDRFDELPRQDRFVLVNNLGDGRIIEAPPSWRQEKGLLVDLHVEAPFPRIRAQELGEDLRLDLEQEDLDANFSTVSGVDALPQRVHLCLWHQQGQFPWSENFGTRLAEFYSLYRESAWLAQLVKLEVIRMASIPHMDSMNGKEYTPFECVTHVRAVDLPSAVATDQRLAVHLTLDVNGVGTWSTPVLLHVPPFPFEKKQLTFDINALLQ